MIERSRNQQMDIRKEEKSRLKREEMAFVEQWKVRNAQLRVEEEMEKIALFQRNKTLQGAHLKAIGRKLDKAQYTRTREMDEAGSFTRSLSTSLSHLCSITYTGTLRANIRGTSGQAREEVAASVVMCRRTCPPDAEFK